MCSFHPWAQLDGGGLPGRIHYNAGQRETGSWWWSSRAGLVAASASPTLPRSSHGTSRTMLSTPPTSHRSSPTSHPTGRSGPRLAQAIKGVVNCSLCLPLTFQMPLKNLPIPLHLAWHWQDQHCQEASGHSRLCDT